MRTATGLAVAHRGMSVQERLWARVDKHGRCWLWLGATENYGYGLIKFEGRTVLVHRVAYEQLVGPIPEGLELDHLCFNRRCVRPDHLEPVTHAENMRRRHAHTSIPTTAGGVR